jgi:hypothetical protein
MSRFLRYFFALGSLPALGLLGSCSSRPGFGTGPHAYTQALNQAFDEIKARSPEGRELASDETLVEGMGVDLARLRGSIEVVVFPKLSNIADKNSEPGYVEYGRPIVYTFNVVRNLECAKLVRERTDKWSHQVYFKDLATSDKRCAVLRVFQSVPQRKPANTRRGDIKEVHVYLDSDYGVYGYDYEIMRSRRDAELLRVQTDPSLAAAGSSGLGLIPLDLPPPNPALAVVRKSQATEVSSDAYCHAKAARA